MSLRSAWIRFKWAIEDGYDKYTGKDKNREALRLQKESELHFEEEKARVNKEEKILNNKVKEIFIKINSTKRDILLESFPELDKILSQLKDVIIPNDLSISEYKNDLRSIELYTKLYEDNKQYVVDFDKQPAKFAAKAFFTFGISTRKEGKKALNNAKINRDSVDNLIEEMNADLKKMRLCCIAADQILFYFQNLKDLFNNTLQYLQHSINYLRYSSMRITKRSMEREMSITMLPIDLQKRLEATLILATVLSKLIIYDDKLLSEQQARTEKEYKTIMSNSELCKCLCYQ